ncbi:MAG TPA: sulfate/molybdate ABC transporter ATP-binding protein, partial [Anaerovoracaceae bacterium]|nr:sulfate/molybdate ABC transporter ATP-binding protein [Anaerovoracaceae bacterium]
MGLQIDITKKLPGFKLEISLACGQEIVAILGPSGSGKSMLLNSIAGLVKPDSGTIRYDDVTFYDSAKKINLPPRDRKTGFLFQNYAMFPHFTVADNIAFGLGKLPREEQQKKVSELLERFHMNDMGKRYPSQISGGQQQRVALARALAVEPRILLLDEPFSALDEHLKTHMLKEMKESLKNFRGTTLFVTHNMMEAYHLADRILILNNGSVETFGVKEEVFSRPVSLAAATITGCKNIASAVRRSDHSAEITGWGVLAATAAAIEHESGFIGIRESNIRLAEDGEQENCYPVWIADESEAPTRTTLYLKIGSAPQHPGDFHIQWEINREERAAVGRLPQPFKIY